MQLCKGGQFCLSGPDLFPSDGHVSDSNSTGRQTSETGQASGFWAVRRLGPMCCMAKLSQRRSTFPSTLPKVRWLVTNDYAVRTVACGNESQGNKAARCLANSWCQPPLWLYADVCVVVHVPPALAQRADVERGTSFSSYCLSLSLR